MPARPKSSSNAAPKKTGSNPVEKGRQDKKHPTEHLTPKQKRVHVNTMNALHSIELFSGAGGLALGLHAAGFRHKALKSTSRLLYSSGETNNYRTIMPAFT